MLKSHIIKGVCVTEKSTFVEYAKKGFRTYVFKADKKATKPEIKKTIEAVFDVKVASVNTLIRKGQTKVTKGRKGRQSDIKKAYVTLEKGYEIDLKESV